MVYMLTKLGYIDGECYHIYHTWILWVSVYFHELPGLQLAQGHSSVIRSQESQALPVLTLRWDVLPQRLRAPATSTARQLQLVKIHQRQRARGRSEAGLEGNTGWQHVATKKTQICMGNMHIQITMV